MTGDDDYLRGATSINHQVALHANFKMYSGSAKGGEKGDPNRNPWLAKMHPNRIQIKFAKYILGDHKSATNIAVLGELGLYPLSIHSLKSCINYWLYLVNTQENSLVFYSYKENILLNDGLFNKAKKFLTDIGFRHVWDNQGTLSRVALLKYIQNKLEERYENFWNNLLSQNTGNENIWGRNKLVRTYHKLKANFEAEKYLYTDVDKCSISTFVRVCN